ncbi:hypothetical protein PR048_026503 [Dryococelus australis]|uniref:DUF659 domain-containing protein n=1 Tax=Dryococelus australis TaxID=614101 RepID=A0ABQ9GLK5_9NEOP|nr:hypothetical protein PR048_026503 [Dryococelus australis]
MRDVTMDMNGRCVFVVLLRILCSNQQQKMFVGSGKVLQNANATECCRIILDVLTEYGAKYDNVVVIVTDAAWYMTLCTQMCKVLCPELLHIECWDHKLYLVANNCSNKLLELNNCMQKCLSSIPGSGNIDIFPSSEKGTQMKKISLFYIRHRL